MRSTTSTGSDSRPHPQPQLPRPVRAGRDLWVVMRPGPEYALDEICWRTTPADLALALSGDTRATGDHHRVVDGRRIVAIHHDEQMAKQDARDQIRLMIAKLQEEIEQ